MGYPPAYQRTTFDGKTVSNRTAYLLKLAQKRLGSDIQLIQGSYNAGGVQASSGTHDGGGAVDVWCSNPDKLVAILRRLGFAAWHRTPSQGPWGHHIHAIDSGDKELSSGARNQVESYKAGRNGLASGGQDDGPRITLKPHRYPPLPTVSTEVVRKQATASKKRTTASVKRVQRALNEELGKNLKVDGFYGEFTKEAMARFEKKHGHDGDGVPNRDILRKLGKGHFRAVK